MAGQGKKSVILVTNALQYLNHSLVDRIVVFQHGRVVEEGTYKDLASNPASVFSKYLTVMSETGVSSTVMGGADVPDMSLTPSEPDSSINDDLDSNDDSDHMEDVSIDTKKPTSLNGELMTNEFKERVVGRVDRQVYLAWGRAAGGVWVPFIIVVVYGIVECVNVSSKWWLTYCTYTHLHIVL
jgi:ABC-type proline/glycine betaine transport system ATPase subunit